MAKFLIFGVLIVSLCFFPPASSEKQIKLEDIERDNLKAAQQAKLEKQYQQYQQSAVQYSQQPYYSQQQAQQPQYQAASQYLLPQQYLQQQQVYPGYAPLASNNLGTGYSSASSVSPYQAYYTPQLVAAVQNLQGSQHLAASTQAQPIIMAIASPSLAGLQQQQYYQVVPKGLASYSGIQYIPSQAAQATQTAQYYYQPQVSHAAAAAPTSAGTSYVYATPQQYLSSLYQQIPTGKVGAYQQQYVAATPSFSPAAYTATAPVYSSAYPSQTSFSSNAASAYPQTNQPTFVSLKAPPNLVASPGQQQQYYEAQTKTQSTTISPFKYLNSPEYLAQNYNTIQSSHLLPKTSFSSGIKSTVSPPLKVASNYVTPSSSTSSASTGLSYHAYRGISG